MVKFVIAENESNQRLDRFLRKYMARAPLGMIYKIIRKDVKLNGKRASADTVIREGDELTLYISEEKLEELSRPVKKKFSGKQFKVAYEDENLLIVEKPRGLLTHGDSTEKKNTMANQVCGYLMNKGEYEPGKEKSFTPSSVNRLDRNTTGLVIFGKNAETMRTLSEYIRKRRFIRKYYLTIVCGKPDGRMMFDDSIVKDESRNISRIAEKNGEGKKSVTYLTTLIESKDFSIVEAEILTGRTHQIRLHFSNAGFPLVGDSKYGNRRINDMMKKRFGVTSQLLHAYKLVFSEITGKLGYLDGLEVKAGIPKDFADAAAGLGFDPEDLEGLGK